MNMWRFNIIFILVIQMILFTVQPAFAEEGSLFTPSGIEIERLENEIDGFMKKHIGVSSPGASVAVVKNGKIVFSKGYGYADIESNESVTTDTVFEYGSVSKVFVWTSVMQLVEQGKLDLDKDIKNYLPEEFYKQLNLRYSITLRDIMNHSSGFGEYSYDLIGLSDQIEDIGLADAILMNHPEQYYKPGTAEDLASFVVELTSEKDEETLLFNERSTLSTMLTSSYQPDASGTAHGLLLNLCHICPR